MTRAVLWAALLLCWGCSGPAQDPPIETARPDRTSMLLEQMAASAYPAEGQHRAFELAVAQDGRRLQARGGQVVLARRPFDLQITFYNSRGLLLDVSFSPRLYKMAVSGVPLSDPFHDGTGMAEHLGNPDKALVVVDDLHSHHFLFYDPYKKQHRCDRVQRVAGGYLCHRRVASLYLKATGKSVPVAQASSKALYLVGYQKSGAREVMRQALKLVLGE